MKVRKRLSLLSALVLLLALAGCGASGSTTSDNASPESAAGYMVAETMADNSLTEESIASAQVPENRKWIVTVDMSAETEDMDTLIGALQEHIDSLGGYVQNQRVTNGSQYSSYRYRSASLTVRIPAEDVDQFTQEVSGISNVVRTNKNLEDVTLSYTATESRVKALETEEARLLELMEQAENMSDLLEIEARLTDVRYELENYTSQLRTYDNKIDFATIYLSIEEVQEYTPVEEETLWERISGGFVSSLKGLGEGALEVLVWVIVSSPYLVVWGIIAAVVIVLVKRHRKRKTDKKRKPTAPAEPEQKEE